MEFFNCDPGCWHLYCIDPNVHSWLSDDAEPALVTEELHIIQGRGREANYLESKRVCTLCTAWLREWAVFSSPILDLLVSSHRRCVCQYHELPPQFKDVIALCLYRIDLETESLSQRHHDVVHLIAEIQSLMTNSYGNGRTAIATTFLDQLCSSSIFP